ncbi:uncharacterized protein ACBT44_001190 isoform 2-T2 [Syngnathus typhle]
MGCSTSSQTSAVDSTKPGIKPEERNGTNTTVTANGNVDGETIPDQTPADSSDVKPTDDTATAAAQEEELQLMDAEADGAPSDPPPEPQLKQKPPIRRNQQRHQLQVTDESHHPPDCTQTFILPRWRSCDIITVCLPTPNATALNPFERTFCIYSQMPKFMNQYGCYYRKK